MVSLLRNLKSPIAALGDSPLPSPSAFMSWQTRALCKEIEEQLYLFRDGGNLGSRVCRWERSFDDLRNSAHRDWVEGRRTRDDPSKSQEKKESL